MPTTVLAAFTLLFRLLGIVLEEDEFPGSVVITKEEEERFTERQQQQDGDDDKQEERKVAFVIEDEEREKKTRVRNLVRMFRVFQQLGNHSCKSILRSPSSYVLYNIQSESTSLA
eukprot:GHVU01113331.1.p1 GENE.GHVU01113331.1~~GHVU01113331.1.p1  ORF type:complete len:115 (-),score=23.61 GHVU01113331.1:161-505(-)